MKGAPGNSLTLNFTESLNPPSGGAVPIDFGVSPQAPVGVGGLYSSQFGSAGVALRYHFIGPLGWKDGSFPSWPLKTPTIERAALKISPQGWQDGVVEAPTYVRWRRFVTPIGFSLGDDIPQPYRVRLAGGYQPAPGTNIILNFAENLVPPPGGAIVLEFGASAQTRVLGVTLGDTQAFGRQELSNPDQIRATGFGPDSVFGVPSIEGNVRYISLSVGIAPPADQVGRPVLTKKAVALLPTGFVATAFGTASAWSWRQYTRLSGFDASLYGTAFLQGGVKHIPPAGIASLAFGTTTVTNTTADQFAAPESIEAPAIPKPGVSPQIVFPFGIGSWSFGTAFVQRNPSPAGFDSAAIGQPVIEYKTRYLLAGNIEPVELGYPVAFDPTRKLFPPSFVEAGLFGDTSIVNKSVLVQVAGSDYAEFSPWTRVESNRRSVGAHGFDALDVGNADAANKTPSIAPDGFDALSQPTADTGIGYSVRYVLPSGVAGPVASLHSVTKTPEVAPLGLAGGNTGTPTVWPRVRPVGADGLLAQKFGEHNVWFRYRTLPVAGGAHDGYGNPAIEHGNRALLLLGAGQSAYGIPSISSRNRTISPDSIFQSFAMAHMVGGLRFLRPVGYDAAQFGARIIPEAQEVYPLGFAGEWGLATAYNKTKNVFVDGFITVGKQPAERMGTAKAHNLVQYVSMSYDPDSGLNPPAWPQWTLIENRNRTVGASGGLASLVPNPSVENKARQILPDGCAAPELPEWQKVGMVAYRVRPLHLDGIEPPYISGWGVVANAARVLAAVGADAKVFGAALVENRSREFKYIGGFDSAWCGYPFVAPRLRQVEFESRYSIEPPRIELPNVRLHTRYIEPSAIPPKQVGASAVEIHWTLITPRWTLQNLYGAPTVRNLTPEVQTRGYAMDEWGNAQARLQWRPLAPDGTSMELFGRTVIADRKQSIFVGGSNYLRIGDKLVVTKTGAPPYSTQFIWLDSLDPSNNPDTGFGISVPEDEQTNTQFGKPSLKQHVIYVHEDKPQTLMGSPRITANSIRVEPGYAELLVGDPQVSLRIRKTAPVSISTDEADRVGRPRLSPHTIYAVVEAPEQAKKNHPTVTPLHYIDSMKTDGIGAVLGRPNVQNQHRKLYASGHYSGGIGTASVMNTINYLEPDGFGAMRFGWHSVPSIQLVEFFTEISTMEFGHAVVKRPPYAGPITVAGVGFDAAIHGNPQVELLNREVRALGFDAAAPGQPRPNDQPFMWQGLRVGPLVPNVPDGIASEVFGELAITHRVRQVVADGFDAFYLEYDYRAFDKRMRVHRGVTNEQPPKIFVSGGQHDAFGTPNARLAAHYIRPDGNSDQYRKGAPS